MQGVPDEGQELTLGARTSGPTMLPRTGTASPIRKVGRLAGGPGDPEVEEAGVSQATRLSLPGVRAVLAVCSPYKL